MKTEKEKREEEEEDLRPFRIHAYSKEELAVGYNKYRRTFTPLEVKVLVKYLGEP